MQDSNDSLQDVAALRGRLARDGYLLVRGLVKQDIATAVADKALSLLREGHFVAPSVGGDRAVRLPSEDPTDRIFGALQSVELFHALGWHSGIRHLAEALLGSSAYAQPKKVFEALFPLRLGDEPLHVHRDNLGGPSCRDMLTFRVALGEIAEGTGGIAVLRGSQDYHHALSRTKTAVPDSLIPVPDDSSSDWVTAELSPGDVILFHCYTVYKVLSNHSNQVQLSAEYRWQSDENPSHISAMLPYRYFLSYPSILGWDDLTADWKDPRWCRYPDSVKIIYSRWADGSDGSVPASRLVNISPHAREYWQPDTTEPEIYRTTPFRLPGTFKLSQPPVPDFTFR